MCDATPVLMSDETHDNAVARTSHAPHVMAALMAARLVDSSNDVARLTGQGLRDTIRIANGAPGLWSDILRSHAFPLARGLAEVREDLAEAAALDTLESSPGRDPGQHVGVISDLLSTGAAGGADTQSRRKIPLTDRVLITVEVGDDFDVTSDDVTLHAAGEKTLTVSVAIPASAEREVQRSLSRAGWGPSERSPHCMARSAPTPLRQEPLGGTSPL